MSTKDITRFLHQPPKHYAAVRFQQGRVLLDSDVNESARLEEHDRIASLSAILGSSASPDVGFTLGRALPIGARPPQASQLRAGQSLPVREVSLNGVKTKIHAVSIRAGSIYLGGMRFELGEPETIAFQRGHLQMRSTDFPALALSPSPSPYSPTSPESPQYPEFHNFYYLNAWEQCVTAVEDEEFLERALSGPDTTVRVRRMRRVELLAVTNPFINSCAEAWEEVIQRLEFDNAVLDRATGELRSKGRLALRFVSVPPSDCEPCELNPPAEYLGPENEAVRIMLTGPNTYVWTTDNGAPLYRVKVTGLGNGEVKREPESGGDGPPDPNEEEDDDDSDEDEDIEDESVVQVELLNPPRDDEHEPRRHRVVEILPFAALIEDGERERRHDAHFLKVAAEVGVFTRVSKYDDETHTFTIDKNVGLQALRDLVHEWDKNHPAAKQLNIKEPHSDARFFYARFWHQADQVGDIELPATNDPNATPLGDTGIVPMFPSAGRRGDTWTATLRPETPERILPFDLLTQPNGVPPHGPRHFYSPLSLLEGDNTTVTRVEDCRPRIHRLTDRGCSTFTVGDGRLSIGDFQKIQDAIDALPIEGGRISLLPGFYPELVVISGRSGVVIEGCGATTVIVPPVGSTTPIIRIVESSDSITISNLTVQVGEQVGISIAESNNVNITGVTLITGVLDGDEFEPGPSDVDIFVVAATLARILTLQNLDIQAQRRPAIRLEECNDSTLRNLRCTGMQPLTSAAPNIPLLVVSSMQGVRILDSSFEMRGATQFGHSAISLDSEVSDAELSGLTITVSSYLQPGEGEEAGDTFFQVPMAIDIDGSKQVRLDRSHLTQMGASQPEHGDHAALVMRGEDLMITSNHIECLNGATWGGVQVRGNSSDVELRGNRIEGGLGHGITVGSLLWAQFAPGGEQRAGIGRSQVRIDPVLGFIIEYAVNPITLENAPDTSLSPLPEGEVTDLRLVDNRIEKMGGNGISTPIVRVPINADVGVTSPTLLVLRNSVVQGNSITGNLQQPGRFNLIDVTDLELFSELLENPPDTDPVLPALPLGGIVLDACFDVEIRENFIFGNGPLPDDDTTRPFCGIFVMTGDDIVIAGNRMSENGPTPDEDSELIPGIRAGISVQLAGVGATDVTFDAIENLLDSGGSGLDSAGVALRVSNNSVQQPEGRALSVVAIGPVTVDGNFLASSGNHVAGSHREAGDVVFIRSHGGAWERVGLTNATFTGSEFTVPGDTQNFLLDGADVNVVGPYGLGGQILFNNNQVTYDWNFKQQPDSPTQEPISHAPIALLTLDHLSVCSNQFALRLSGLTPDGLPAISPEIEPIATHVLAVGATVQVEHNRFSEEVGTVFASLVSTARLLNMTAFNQSTHVQLVRHWTNETDFFGKDLGNQIMFLRADFSPDEDTARAEFAIEKFYEFLWTTTTAPP